MFHLGWFMGSGFSVQTWALDPWAGNTGHDWMKGDLFVDLAASLERARFDYLLVEDTSMVEDAYGRSMETTLKYGMLAPKCDPVPLIPLLTQRTKHIGIAVTLSTSFYHPFMAARTMTTLDHLTDGRVGLNVVTGSSCRAAQQSLKNWKNLRKKPNSPPVINVCAPHTLRAKLYTKRAATCPTTPSQCFRRWNFVQRELLKQ